MRHSLKKERKKKKLFGPLITAVGSRKDRFQLRQRIFLGGQVSGG
jgi:hypothetical protein